LIRLSNSSFSFFRLFTWTCSSSLCALCNYF
jgi:hypothetical protein